MDYIDSGLFYYSEKYHSFITVYKKRSVYYDIEVAFCVFIIEYHSVLMTGIYFSET